MRVGASLLPKTEPLPVVKQTRFAPNIDVVTLPHGRTYKYYAIECKFTEAYSGRGHGGLNPKYFENERVWDGLL